MKNIEIKKCRNCSEGTKELYMDGELILEGDYYHTNISSVIEGFVLALKKLNIEFSLKDTETYECPYFCD